MEPTLATRKIVFGMLLVLVLVFSMQGIADAQDTDDTETGGRLRVWVDPFDGAPGSTATVTFTVIGADNQPAFLTVGLSATGGTLSRSSEWTGTGGSGTVTLTRGNTPGNENYVTASTHGYASARTRFLITGTPTRTTTTTARTAAVLAIYNGNLQRGALNVPLAEPFIVEVMDANYSPVEDVRVQFRVTQGSGRFSPRVLRTDAEGLAETTFTPISAGRIRVKATVGGVNASAEFIVSVEEAPEAADPVIFSTSIDPKVLVAAANRPPMLWVDSGTIYGLVGADVKEEFVQGVDNAMNIAVDANNGKVYWTEKTGESRGTINSANLDGTSVTELTAILSVPMGLSVDATGSKLYWTNTRGRIQRAKFDGSGIENVVQDLSGPTDIVVSNGFIYWTEGDNSIRRVSISGQKIVGDVAANLGTVGGLTVGGGKVYWTEKTASGGGTINSANADGTGATELALILATPMGISVDATGNKLYWTNARGRIQRANLNGSGIKNVVDGLGSPGEIVISNSITGTPPTTTSKSTAPKVLVAAANRPSILWVDGGAIYALVGANPQRFAPSVDNAMNIAVGGGKLYWTEQTGESGGTINSVNLNGTGVTELVSIFAVPMGIAVDTAGSKLYWTNTGGRIQSANLNGSGIQNVLQNLDNPMDIALAGGNVYWTQGNPGSVRFVNLRGQKQIHDISTGSDTPGSLVIGGGKVYWTEMTGESGGTINSANLNGTGATQLASILATPMGIAVDTVRSKLYWANSRGRVQSANLDGSKIQNVVSGLGSPGELVLGNSIAAPTTTTPTTRTTTTASKYDVNKDGAVDNMDASLVIDALGTSDAQSDVNNDGTVDFLDVVLVFDNRDDNAAAAPTIVGMKLSAAQIDRIQEQIDLLLATNDRSPAAMRTLVYLQQLLVTARPGKTQLLANYPNPFNPETWIPYELATDTHVEITIYNTQGVVIRRLQLGQQSAGYYTGRDRAVYWDGRNALGEQVASGLYFYQFETDEMSSLRKMVILK